VAEYAEEACDTAVEVYHAAIAAGHNVTYGPQAVRQLIARLDRERAVNAELRALVGELLGLRRDPPADVMHPTDMLRYLRTTWYPEAEALLARIKEAPRA
jgi:hypothetical protein